MYYTIQRNRDRGVAQFGRALRSGRRGRKFESCRLDLHLFHPAEMVASESLEVGAAVDKPHFVFAQPVDRRQAEQRSGNRLPIRFLER